MIADPVLLAILAGEGAAILAVWVLVLGHGAFSGVGRRRRERVARAHAALTAALLERAIDETGRTRLRRLRFRDLIGLLADVAPHLKGAEREWLSDAAAELGVVGRARRLCRSRRWWKRLHGARILTLVGGGEETILGLARDRSALVRSEVAEWAGTYPTAEGIRTLTGMLGDPSQVSRFSVQDALIRIGGEAVSAMAERLNGVTEPLAAISGLTVARGLGDPRLLDPVLALSWHGSAEVRGTAYRALGTMAGDEAADRLVEGLQDPDSAARAAAVTALGWMGHWRAAAAVSHQLGDRSWDVRLAAGRALIAMGPPGRLMLRTTASSAGGFAADMARHIMDVSGIHAVRSA